MWKEGYLDNKLNVKDFNKKREKKNKLRFRL